MLQERELRCRSNHLRLPSHLRKRPINYLRRSNERLRHPSRQVRPPAKQLSSPCHPLWHQNHLCVQGKQLRHPIKHVRAQERSSHPGKHLRCSSERGRHLSNQVKRPAKQLTRPCSPPWHRSNPLRLQVKEPRFPNNR
jgi:hypothetical protein